MLNWTGRRGACVTRRVLFPVGTRLPSRRDASSSTPIEATSAQPGLLRSWFDRVVANYEDFIGVKAVREAQQEVMAWEERLSAAQLARRDKQAELKSVQARLKELHTELDRTSRGEDRYLHLLTEEHATIKKERALLEQFEGVENAEREAFHQLSNRVRSSHEKERERVEKTKYWSLSASLIGALLGIFGTSIGNELRMRRFKELLPTSEQITPLIKDFTQLVAEEHKKLGSFIVDMKESLKLDDLKVDRVRGVDSTLSIEKMVDTLRTENERLFSQLEEMKRLVKLEHSVQDPAAVVYVGSDMERLLDQTEKNLESKMKLQTLLSVVFLYTAIGVTIPLIFAYFKGN